MHNEQLTLSLHLNDNATFDNFITAKENTLLALLNAALSTRQERFFYLYGPEGSGRSHLLQACCHRASELGLLPVYFAASDLAQHDPAVFEGLSEYDVICLDDIHLLMGQSQWEEALFHLYNAIRDTNAVFIVSALASPRNSGILLPDLASRLAWGIVYQLSLLGDSEKLQALQTRAHQRGMNLPTGVGEFILRRYGRDMPSLYAALEQLDHASLVAKRRLTIPFVKSVLTL